MGRLISKVWHWMHTRKCAAAPVRPTVTEDPTFAKYCSGYLWLRVFVGALGVLLPLLLLLGDAIFLDTHKIAMRPSLSASTTRACVIGTSASCSPQGSSW